MKYSEPMPYKTAMRLAGSKTLLPTGLGTADLQRLAPSVRERALFSAKVRTAEHLSVLDDGISALVSGQSDVATQRLALKQYLAQIGYRPAEGEAGGLKDFSSDARINLQLLTNVQQAQGYGWWKQGQDVDLLDAFPAQEFVRVKSRRVPRTNWHERWDAARAATISEGATASGSGRMVALKNHPIWAKLSRFGTPYGPFDFGSGMGVEDVSRREAMALRLIDRDTQISPQDRPFNQGLQASPAVRSETLRGLLEQSGVGTFEGDVFVAKGGV